MASDPDTEKIIAHQELVRNSTAPPGNAATPPADPKLEQKSPEMVLPVGNPYWQPGPKFAERTVGLKLFDVFLYPMLTNVGVWVMSVGATYLTQKGHLRNPETGKLLYGKVGEWFHNRGNAMIGALRSTGMSQKQAEMGNMVAWSFIDGTMIAPLVKLVEDRREKISKRLDDAMGTKPEDELAAYKEEPKQSWGSVIGGRVGTASVVVPTAIVMDKTGWNDVLFNNPGKRFGEWAAHKPDVVKFFSRLNIPREAIPMVGKIGVFEVVYTSICTAGLYFGSRELARLTNRTKTGEVESIIDNNGHDIRAEIQAEEKPPAARREDMPTALMQPTELNQHSISMERI